MNAAELESTWVLAAAVARGLLAAPFVLSAVAKLRDWPGGLNEVRALGLPWPTLALAATVALQLAGGLMLALNWQARWAAAALAAFTLLASVMAHPFWRIDGPRGHQHSMTFAEHLAIVGGLLMVVVHG
jgi:putative oxidoreductase